MGASSISRFREYRGYIGIMEKQMETTIMGFCRVLGLGLRFLVWLNVGIKEN